MSKMGETCFEKFAGQPLPGYSREPNRLRRAARNWTLSDDTRLHAHTAKGYPADKFGLVVDPKLYQEMNREVFQLLFTSFVVDDNWHFSIGLGHYFISGDIYDWIYRSGIKLDP